MASWRADLLLLMVVAVWGSTFVVVRDAVAEMGTMGVLASRFTVAALALGVFGFKSVRTARISEIRAGVAVGLAYFLGFALQTAGLASTTASKAGFITGLSVVGVPFIAYLVWKVKPSVDAVAGVIFATAGLAFLSLADVRGVGIGDLLVLGCAVAFSVQYLLVSHFSVPCRIVPWTFYQLVTVALLSLMGSALSGTSPLPASTRAWSAALFLGLVATALVTVLQNIGQRYTTATRAALIFSLEPVFAAIFGHFIQGDQLTGRMAIGAALILLGMITAELQWVTHWRLRREEQRMITR
ncbi:DMT family transporter [Kyrpidia tusciae]|uniref:EamA domain-containing protein n=1 Tax=Kyrpidia tusciae (strain DSM 2912 / NBRC 15312 / T2) TaxID=562970 RepID=D5WSB5_KYRT2|nr:DMT family transporter [Kyrpidia tusciae]ADG05000.1 protein of unknown function DUF6 transmembrane [Kyrpidia tusciae DSM 2912]